MEKHKHHRGSFRGSLGFVLAAAGSAVGLGNIWRFPYLAARDGSWTYKPKGSWKKNSKGWWFGDTSGWYAKNTTVKIDGTNYKFDASGYWVK